MRQKIQMLPKYKQYIFNLLLSAICMTAAAGISSMYYQTASENSVNIALVFTFFLVLISHQATGYFYGIICSLLSVLCFNFLYKYPYFSLNFTLSGYPVTFLIMSAITILVRAMTSHLIFQKNMLAKKEKQLAEAEKERMRANLLRAVSHDLRTPLTGILGNTLAFLENQEQLSEEGKREIVTNIYRDSRWLINMTENLLTITRINGTDLSINTSEESLEEVVAEALQKTEKRHPGCDIRAKIPEELLMLPMDAILIEQVIINLLENALFHSGSSRPVEFFAEDMGTEVLFTVKDYGTGIPQEKLEHLFDGLDYASREAADIHKGMGIGLMICKTIVTAHHGTLTGRNHEMGAEFSFSLPKTKESDPPQ